VATILKHEMQMFAASSANSLLSINNIRGEIKVQNVGIEANTKTDGRSSPFKKMKKCWRLYVLVALPVIYVLVFCYYPMLGAQLAFRDFNAVKGIWGSDWVGLKYFKQFIESPMFWLVLKNTVVISLYGLIVGFPFPIVLALSLNYVTNKFFKKTLQMISYAPNFISTVVMSGMILQFLNPRTGLVNNLIELIGRQRIDFMGNAGMFLSIYVWTGIWQGVGFGSIIYLAALTGVSPELHEAAIIDGANKIKRMWYVDIPSILPTAIILLIMNTGQILNVGFEKVLLLQTPLNVRTSEIIATYVYKVGLTADFPNYSFATAIGLFQSLVGLMLLMLVNKVSQKFSETSLW
jgi:putative aldouronate transport system permease protein